MKLRLGLLFAGALWLAGCASPLPALRQERAAVRDFSLEARFALRLALAGRPVQSSGGRLSWMHGAAIDRLLIANPLGMGLAEIEMNPLMSRLQTADGRQHESSDPAALLEEVTGLALPVRRLPAWLLGTAGPDAILERDASGRPLRLREAEWQVDYTYADDLPGALPAGLTLSRGAEVELRLRIEAWRETP